MEAKEKKNMLEELLITDKDEKESSSFLECFLKGLLVFQVVAFIFILLVPKSHHCVTYCTQAYSCNCPGNGALCDCTYLDEDNKPQPIKCPEDK